MIDCVTKCIEVLSKKSYLDILDKIIIIAAIVTNDFSCNQLFQYLIHSLGSDFQVKLELLYSEINKIYPLCNSELYQNWYIHDKFTFAQKSINLWYEVKLEPSICFSNK